MYLPQGSTRIIVLWLRQSSGESKERSCSLELHEFEEILRISNYRMQQMQRTLAAA